MRKNPTLSERPADQCENPKRRLILGLAIGTVVAATTRSIFIALQPTDESNPTESTVEKKTESFIIPEDERTGQDILLTATYDSYVEINGANCFTQEPLTTWTSILKKLPAGTNVRLLVPINFADWCTKMLQENYPNLNISTYNLNALPEHITAHLAYPQDYIFPTGRVDKNGRFIIATGTLDFDFLEIKYEIFGSPEEKAESEDDKLFRKLRFAGDDVLVNMHPDTFVAEYIPIFCPGGDLQVVRLPDGRSAAIVGKSNIANSCMILRYLTGEKRKEFLSKPITLDELESVKKTYKDALKVNEVIFIDKQHTFEEAENGNIDPRNMTYGSAFFHSDMIVKTATDPKNPNKRLAFYNNIPSLLGISTRAQAFFEDIRYLNRVHDQFQGLGYEMVGLPCGPRSVLNYVNCTMFTKDGIHYVMVPQYGILEDEKAVEIYEQRGFKVVKVDMSYLIMRGEEAMSKGGSVHCGMVVLK
ncbi:MAG: hypothetical protein AAB540_01705 [Patescibacteria group bacterium]